MATAQRELVTDPTPVSLRLVRAPAGEPATTPDEAVAWFRRALAWECLLARLRRAASEREHPAP